MPRSWAERERLAYVEGRVEEAALLAALLAALDDGENALHADYDAGYNTAVAELQEP